MLVGLATVLAFALTRLAYPLVGDAEGKDGTLSLVVVTGGDPSAELLVEK